MATTTDWTDERFEFESRQGQNFSPLHVVQTYYGVQPAAYSMSTVGFFLGDKAAGRKTDQSSPTSAEVKNTWVYIPTLPYVLEL
jgi:hypothetical protein